MVNFAYPKLLFLLFAIPVIAALYFGARYLRRRNLRRFGNPEVLESLMPDVSRYLPAVKLTVSLLAIAALVVVLARPRSMGKVTEESQQGIEVMIAVDVSNSMRASSTDDPRGVSRLQRAKHVLGRLIDNLGNDRVGLIVFAGEAFTQLPLTPDFISAKMYLNDISTNMIENQGTSIGAAIEVAMNSFSGAKDVERAIVLITDAEDQIGDAEQMAEVAHREGIEVDVIGLGSGKGAQIPLDNSYSNWLKDDDGRVVTTYLNEELAQNIARAGGGVYINGASPSALNDLVKRLDEIKKSDLGTVTYSASDEQFPLFAAIALALIVLDCIFSNRKIGFLRKYNFFSRGAAVVALIMLPALASAALPKSQPIVDTSTRKERRFIDEGNKQFSDGHYREAEISYRRALDSNPNSEIARYNEALTRIYLGAAAQEENSELMKAAVETMNDLLNNAQNPEVAEHAAYDLGNIAFQSQQLQQALQLYRQALRINPQNQLTRENYRFVEKMLQQNQNQQDQQQDQQEQEQQQQEQEQQQQQQQQEQQQQEQEQQQQQQQQQRNNQQILDAVEKKDAAARARAARQQNGNPEQSGAPVRGKKW